MTTQTFHQVEADFFADCSGDSILAPLTGAEFRVGREAKSEFGESLAQDEADRNTMGMSCIMQLRETDSPKKFIPPAWAEKFPTDESFPKRGHLIKWFLNFWYLEYGGDQDSIKDTEEIRDDLIKTAFGMWDHMKNHGDHQADNWILDWMGFLPGKRESRRYVGDYILTQHDVVDGSSFDDIVAFGGWPVDDHHPAGFRYFGPPNMVIEPGKSYGIPLRCLYSKNIPNLMFAGRNISATHMAMSSTRVMATCAVIGQAAGTGAALAVDKHILPAQISESYIDLLQQQLLEDGCFIPEMNRKISGNVAFDLPEADRAILNNGWDRPHDGAANSIMIPDGGSLSLHFENPASCLRIALDPDFSRESISQQKKYQKFAMRTHIDETTKVAMPENLLKSCTVTAETAEGSRVWRIENNRQALRYLDLPKGTVRVLLSQLESWGGKETGIFSCDTV